MRADELQTAAATREGYVRLSPLTPPLQLEGYAELHDGVIYRVPYAMHDRINDGATPLTSNTAGVCLRYCTDALHLHVQVETTHAEMMAHMALSGSTGCDVYVDGRFVALIRPNIEVVSSAYEGDVTLDGAMHAIQINLPLYNGVAALSLEVPCDARVLPPPPYARSQPVVFYGSSITQGGCASRPGNAYTSIVCRELNLQQRNLGFSGSGRGEKIMADYIASLPMCAFVLDYDHNAPTPEHLRRTHLPFYEAVRATHPDIPIVLMTRPDSDREPADAAQRRAIIAETYTQKKSAGENVWFVDGATMFGSFLRDGCTVDTTHPNDLGFARMAQAVLPALRQGLQL